MSKVRIPSQKKQYEMLNRRLVQYIESLQSIYDVLNLEASNIALLSDFDGEGQFRFSDYPITKDRLDKLQQRFVDDIGTLIYTGTSAEWKKSNLFQDLIADKVIKAYTRDTDRRKHTSYYKYNNEAKKAFQERTDRGMNLSDKLWSQSESYKEELEDVLSVSIEKGIDAVTLSKRVSKYLQDFDTFKNAYEEKFGHATKVEDCEYRSIRLARSEINMAYRTAEQKRWKQFDFVLGYEIKLSHAHPQKDICDELVGKYPKDFVWTGWHPNCMDYCVPILMTEDEFFAITEESPNLVKDVPEVFKEWCNEHSEAINVANKRNTLPYFLKDNKKYIPNNVLSSKRQMSLKEIDDIGWQMQASLLNDEVWTQSDFSKIDFSKLKSDIEKSFELLGVEHEDTDFVVRCYGGRGPIRSMSISVRNPKAQITRIFRCEDDKIIVEHDYFELSQELQGKGFSKNILSSFLEQYERIGVDKIELYANIDVGGYAWARYGFSADRRDVYGIIRNYNIPEVKERAKSIVDEFYSNHSDEYKFPMYLLSNEEFGKDLLLGSSWHGEIDLKDKKAVSVFKKYLRTK